MFLAYHLNRNCNQVSSREFGKRLLIGGFHRVPHTTNDEGSVRVHVVSVNATDLFRSCDLSELVDARGFWKSGSHHIGRWCHSDQYDYAWLTCVRLQIRVDPDNLRRPGLAPVGC